MSDDRQKFCLVKFPNFKRISPSLSSTSLLSLNSYRALDRAGIMALSLLSTAVPQIKASNRSPLYSEISRYFSSLHRSPASTSLRPFQVSTLRSRWTGEEARKDGPGERKTSSYISSLINTRSTARRSYSTVKDDSKQNSNPSPPSATKNHSLAKQIPHPLVSKPYPHYLASLPSSLRRVAASLPSVTGEGRPPTRDQLLELTTSFFDRLKIRFKWATIRSYRRFRMDDWSAFFSIGIFGTLGWFLLKTTSAFAVLFVLVNSLSSQEWLAKKLGGYLTESTGVKVVFESAIVPKWGILGRGDGDTGVGGGSTKIVFKNVYISRGPVKGELGVLPSSEELEDEKGLVTKEERDEVLEKAARLKELVSQWTHFHLSIDTVEVTLSLRRWLDGKGLVKSAAVRGVRGVVGEHHRPLSLLVLDSKLTESCTFRTFSH